MLRACAFDLGNTLSNDQALLEAALAETTAWLVERGAIRDAAAFVAAYEQIHSADHRPFISHTYGEPEFFQEAFARFGVRGISPAEALEHYRLRVRERMVVDPELPGALEWLRSRGLRLAIISNERTARVDAFLAKTGIGKWFDPVVVSEAVGVQKPDAGIFRIALERMGTAPEETAMFGDNAVADGACRLLGMPFVLVTQYHRKGWVWEAGEAHVPDHTLERIGRGQLARLLAALGS